MRYLYVQRPAQAGAAIGLDEWRSAAQASPDLELLPSPRDSDGLRAQLRGSPRQQLNWRDGRLYTRNPSQRLAQLMFELARRLGAEVVGGSGRRYAAYADWQRREGRLRRRSRRQRGGASASWLIGLLLLLGVMALLLAQAALS